ncbi:MAG: GerMN domain-containing protein [Acidobacteriaceae bacterium]
MIQRHQRIVFWCLVVCIVGMGVLLAMERQRGRQRVEALASDQTPLDAPTAMAETVTLDLANDDDGSITAETRQIALPQEANARARALIEHLIAEYALPGSPHPLPPGSAVSEVFLIPLPVVGYTTDATSPTTNTAGFRPTVPVAPDPGDTLQPKEPGGELAVIDLHSTFVNQHPSGVEVESLTLRSILGTLHANLPQIEQVRFLVDGQARETLAGHADLLRTYPARDTTTSGNVINAGQSIQ